MRRGQTWAVDFIVSLVVFTAAVLIAYNLVGNSFKDNDIAMTRLEVAEASAILGGDGYPAHWTNDTVIRAGLAGDGQFSHRKAQEIALLSDNDLRQALRLTHSFAVYAFDAEGIVRPYLGECALGDLIPQPASELLALPAVSVVGSVHPVTDMMENITVYANTSWFGPATGADVIVFEGDLSGQDIQRRLQLLATHGVTIVVLGDIGAALPGVVVNDTNATNLTVLDERFINITQGEAINVSETPVDTIYVTPTTAENFVTLAENEHGQAVYATWTYNDARIVALGIVEGKRADGTDMQEWIANTTTQAILVPWDACAEPTPPAAAKQVAHYDRSLAYHGTIVTLRTVVWRE